MGMAFALEVITLQINKENPLISIAWKIALFLNIEKWSNTAMTVVVSWEKNFFCAII